MDLIVVEENKAHPGIEKEAVGGRNGTFLEVGDVNDSALKTNIILALTMVFCSSSTVLLGTVLLGTMVSGQPLPDVFPPWNSRIVWCI